MQVGEELQGVFIPITVAVRSTLLKLIMFSSPTTCGFWLSGVDSFRSATMTRIPRARQAVAMRFPTSASAVSSRRDSRTRTSGTDIPVSNYSNYLLAACLRRAALPIQHDGCHSSLVLPHIGPILAKVQHTHVKWEQTSSERKVL